MTWLSCICGQSDPATKIGEIGSAEEQCVKAYQCADREVVGNVTIYPYKELRIATNDFSKSYKIGQGGFGSVYKGRLRGQMRAVKVLSSESKQGVKEFLTEIKVISDLHHENLVDLSGCCVEGDHRILVYNYLENGSLDKTLLGKGHSSVQFSWPTRVKICLGVARGLAYLHEEVIPHVIHRDIKASNILIGKDLTPKISDFGLAKLISANTTHVTTRVAGTLGYLAPEYAIRGQVTRKSDVYSFGVLLIEIVSGRCNTNSQLPRHDRFLLSRAWESCKKKELAELVDTSLSGDFDVEQACKFFKIGLLCTQNAPKLRPSMSTVVLMLKGEKDVNESSITAPGMLSDFMDVGTDSMPKDKADKYNNKSSDLYTTGSDTIGEITVVSETSSQVTMTFTSIYDRSR